MGILLTANERHCCRTTEEMCEAQLKEVVSLVVAERKIYKLLYEKHKELNPNEKQSDLFYKGYMRGLQVIINKLKQALLKEARLNKENK